MGFEKNEGVKLYIRFPCKIVDEHQVKALHPAISAVYLPRQNRRRWCFIYFKTQEILEEAEEDLKKIQIENKLIKVFPSLKVPESVKSTREERRKRKQERKLQRKLAKAVTLIKKEEEKEVVKIEKSPN